MLGRRPDQVGLEPLMGPHLHVVARIRQPLSAGGDLDP